jgi:hypothetical protein
MPKVNYTKAKGLFQESSTLEGMRIFGESQAITTAATNQSGGISVTGILAIVTMHANNGSVLLPEGEVGDMRFIVNTHGAHNCKVFPSTGEKVNGAGANAAFDLAAGKRILCVYGSAGRGWELILTA